MQNERNGKPALLVHTEIFKQARNNVPKAIKHAKASHFYAKLEDAELDSKKMFFLLNTLLNRWDRSDSLPVLSHPKKLLNRFPRFFPKRNWEGKNLMMILLTWQKTYFQCSFHWHALLFSCPLQRSNPKTHLWVKVNESDHKPKILHCSLD